MQSTLKPDHPTKPKQASGYRTQSECSRIDGFAFGKCPALKWTLGGHHYVQQGRVQEATRLRAENDQLRLKISRQRQAQLEKAGVQEPQVEAGVISNTTPTEISEAGRSGAPTAEISRVPGTEYRNEGQTTPIAALQTYAWACDRGDTATKIHLIRFDESVRRKAVAYMATPSEEARAPSNSPEAMAGGAAH